MKDSEYLWLCRLAGTWRCAHYLGGTIRIVYDWSKDEQVCREWKTVLAFPFTPMTATPAPQRLSCSLFRAVARAGIL
jgi:hypothetical protein